LRVHAPGGGRNSSPNFFAISIPRGMTGMAAGLGRPAKKARILSLLAFSGIKS
jgi:hypothetical protein